jgi:hypothetical protein
VLFGEPSHGLIDIDLDCVEAVRAAPHLLPPTRMITGRRSAPQSHWWYRVGDPPAKASEAFDDPSFGESDDRRRLVELRSTGGQTVIPPSVHPSGERCVWHEHGQPARVSITELRADVGAVAAAAALGRHWPTGARHDAALALAGGLLRARWDEDKVARFVAAVCAAAGDPEIGDRVRSVLDTAQKLKDGKPATAWTRLVELLGADGPPAAFGATVLSRSPSWRGPTGRPHAVGGGAGSSAGAGAARRRNPRANATGCIPASAERDARRTRRGRRRWRASSRVRARATAERTHVSRGCTVGHVAPHHTEEAYRDRRHDSRHRPGQVQVRRLRLPPGHRGRRLPDRRHLPGRSRAVDPVRRPGRGGDRGVRPVRLGPRPVRPSRSSPARWRSAGRRTCGGGCSTWP